MQVERLLAQLKDERLKLDAAIGAIERYTQTPQTAARMIKSWEKNGHGRGSGAGLEEVEPSVRKPKRGRPRKKLTAANGHVHWTKRPENAAAYKRWKKNMKRAQIAAAETKRRAKMGGEG